MRRTSLLFTSLLFAGCSSSISLNAPHSGPRTLAQVQDSRIDESSGIAESPTKEGVFYTHNDSGNKPAVFRFDPRDGGVTEVSVEGAKNVDWEDMAAATIDGQPYLFVGDIGDNSGRRDSIVVYRIPEPSEGSRIVRPDEVYTLRYPDEPHNAETLMVHPKTGDLYVVTKAATRSSMVFKLARPQGDGKYMLSKVGEIQLGGDLRESRLATGGAISPDGTHVVLRTYMGAYEFAAPKTFDGWVKASPRSLRTNLDGQGEAITYSRDGESLITTSEGTPMLVSVIARGD